MRTLRLITGLVTAAAAVVVVVIALGLQPGTDHDASGSQASGALSQPLLPATVSIDPAARGRAVPSSFLGISTEYWTLPFWEQQVRVLERVLALLHASGDGPFVLRIGGDSADHAFWEPSRRETPEWAFELDPAWLSQTRTLVAETRARVILDLNLVTATPRIAALWAEAAEAAFPRGSILGFEIGNEPDIYSRDGWLTALKDAAGLKQVLPAQISAAGYAHDFAAYARVISRFAPAAHVFGPALANPVIHADWVSVLLHGPHPGLAMITAHRYPYSECAFPGTPAFATVDRLLSEHATAGMARALRPAIELAHRYGLPFHLTELNSVTCGGRPGVSNSFATALWAPDALFELLQAGVDGVNIHVREHAINAAFVLTPDGLMAHPLLYGLITFARMLGPQARLMATHVHAPAVAHLKAWGVRVSGGIVHLLLIDKGTAGVRVALRVPARGVATVERLLAPSAGSHSDVTLAGQYLDRQGRWRGEPVRATLVAGRHGFVVIVPRQTAALVTLRLRTASVSHGRRRSI